MFNNNNCPEITSGLSCKWRPGCEPDYLLLALSHSLYEQQTRLGPALQPLVSLDCVSTECFIPLKISSNDVSCFHDIPIAGTSLGKSGNIRICIMKDTGCMVIFGHFLGSYTRPWRFGEVRGWFCTQRSDVVGTNQPYCNKDVEWREEGALATTF